MTSRDDFPAVWFWTDPWPAEYDNFELFMPQPRPLTLRDVFDCAFRGPLWWWRNRTWSYVDEETGRTVRFGWWVLREAWRSFKLAARTRQLQGATGW